MKKAGSKIDGLSFSEAVREVDLARVQDKATHDLAVIVQFVISSGHPDF